MIKGIYKEGLYNEVLLPFPHLFVSEGQEGGPRKVRVST